MNADEDDLCKFIPEEKERPARRLLLLNIEQVAQFWFLLTYEITHELDFFELSTRYALQSYNKRYFGNYIKNEWP